MISTLHVCSQDQKLNEAIGWLRKEVHHLLAPSPGSPGALGRAWVALALLMIDFYVPNLPMDPVAGNQAYVNILHGRRQRLQQEIQLLQIIAKSRTGYASNLLIERLLRRLSGVELEISAQSHIVKRDTDAVHLQELFTEIHQFQTRVLTSVPAHNLADAMTLNPSEAITIETVLQESIMNFQRRLNAAYSRFADIIIPLDEWLTRLRFGLRILRDHRNAPWKSEATSLAQSVTTFPPAIAALKIRADTNTVTTLGDKEDLIILRLQAIEHEVLLGINTSKRLTEFSKCFDELFRIWVKEQKEKARRDAENASLYRGGVNKTEHELEEAEFREMFPQYDDVMDENKTGAAPEHSVSRSTTAVVSRIFANLMHTSKTFTPPGRIFAASFATKWLPSVITQLPMSLDRHSIVWSLRYLQDHMERFLRSPAAKTYNFYKDVNATQISRVIPILLSLRDRLSLLIDHWPDQMVLQYIRERCDAILNLDVNSPVPRILSALELLLLQIEDWEQYAYRENTIKEWQGTISSLVIEWRRLELSSWAQLLNHEYLACMEGTSEWWFRIYEATVYGTRAAVLEGTLDHHLSGLLPLLESFLMSSSVGEYSTRLQLLRSFGKYTSALAKSGQDHHGQAMARVSRLLEAISCFYGRFSDQIFKSFDQQRVELDKEVDSFIKLASWKDLNVFALKASAHRTHRQLYKSIKKFRQILRQPATPYLETKLQHSPRCREEVTYPMLHLVPTAPDLQFPAPVPAHRRHLNSTISRFDTLLLSVLPKLHFFAPVATESFVNSIIETNQELATDVPPKEVKDASKWHKNLLTRKKAAFSRLLKTCKVVGLSDNIQASVLERQRNRVFLFEQRRAFPETESAYRISMAKADLYFDRILAHLPKFEASLASHSSDISTRELTRLLNCTHSTLSRGLLTRDLWVPSLTPFCPNADFMYSLYEATAVSEQLKTVSLDISLANEGDALVLVGDSALSYANAHTEALCYVVAALEEILLCLGNPEVSAVFQPHVQPNILASLQKQKGVLQVKRDYALAWFQRASTTCLPLLWQSEHLVSAFVRRYSRTPVGQAHKLESATSIHETITQLQVWGDQDHATVHHCGSLLIELNTITQRLPPAATRPPDGLTLSTSEPPIDRILVIMQRLSDLALANEGDAYIKIGIAQAQAIHQSLEFVTMRDDITTFLLGRGLEGGNGTVLLQRLQPFLQRYLRLADVYLDMLAGWHKSLLKLASTLLIIGQELADRGFCKPTEMESESKQQEMVGDGTGIGEGSGKADVSKDITDESQVEGLQDQQKQEDVESEEKDEADGAIEMDGDFDADVEETQEEAKTKDEEEPPEVESPSEEMAQLDRDDPNVVDEIFWGQEGHDQQQVKPEPAQEGESKGLNDAEVVAKAQQASVPPANHKGETASGNDDPGDEIQMEEPQIEDMGEQTNDDGRPVDDYVDQQEPLSLPDDLHIDDSRNDRTEGLSDDGESMSDVEGDVGVETGDTEPPDHSDEETSGHDNVEDATEKEDQDIRQEKAENITAKPDLREGEGTDQGGGDGGEMQGSAPATNQDGVDTENKDEVSESVAKEARAQVSQR